ncbi:group I truncated hemoglobin [Klenkia terrae]|uniref:Group 1 truncated hemoglobin n=1 Tax=Klenkia terrae TaxID=1052259 RepID=A0ABU8E1M7_9ACTN|nr:group 1 truncated hemoglobin [Klenkia terrae]
MVQPTGSASLLDTAVARFYDLVLDDPRLAHWFSDVDMTRLRRHQAEFLGTALDGGASRYDLRRAHAGLGIDDAAFDRVVEHLGAALAAVGIEDGHRRDIQQAAAGLRDQVVEA